MFMAPARSFEGIATVFGLMPSSPAIRRMEAPLRRNSANFTIVR